MRMLHKQPFSKTATLALILLVGLTLAQTQDIEGDTCKIDSDCSPPYYTCVSNECTHKSLWKPQLLEIAGVIILLFLSMLAVASGIGGGAFLVPINLIFFQFGPKTSIAMSNGIMFFNSIVVYLMSLRKSNPVQKHKALIDYNLAILMMPPMMIGNLIGSFAAVLVPSVAQVVMLSIVLAYSIYKTQAKARQNWKKESEAIAAKKKAAEKDKKSDDKNKDQEKNDNKEEGEEVEIVKQDSRAKEKKDVEEVENTKEDKSKKAEIEKAEKKPVAFDNETRRPGEREDDMNYQKRLKIIKTESSNFNWIKLSICYSISLLALAFVLLRGGKGLDSLIGIERCHAFDWLLILGYLFISSLYMPIVYKIIKSEQIMKAESGWAQPDKQLVLTPGKMICLMIVALITGFLGAILGIGGNTVISPFLLEMGVPAQVISTTGQFLIFLNKAVATCIFIIMGILPYDYLIVIGVLSMIGIAISMWQLNYYVKKLNRQSLISFLFVGIVTLALVVIVLTGVLTIVQDPGKSLEFKGFC